MSKKLNALKIEHAAQIEDFKNQLKMKDEELIKANAEITSLKDSLDNSAKELLEVKGNLDQATSALMEKTNALATLNAGVNVPKDNESKKDTWKSLRGDEFFAWLKEYTQSKKSK